MVKRGLDTRGPSPYSKSMGSRENQNPALHDLDSAYDPRSFEQVTFEAGSMELEVMRFGGRASQLRPLVVLHSLEYPIPPSAEFCRVLAQRGLQVIFVRRPGFGRSTNLPEVLYSENLIEQGATCAAEAALMAAFISQLELENCVLLALATAAPLGCRIAALSRKISQTILVNPRLNRADWDDSRPGWFRDMLKQIIKHRSGIRIAEKGMKFLVRRDTLSFYKQFLKTSAADLDYFSENQPDFASAKAILLGVSSDVIFADTKISVETDRFLSGGCFDGLPVSVVGGADSSDTWRAGLASEAARVGASFFEVPNGDLFCVYQNPRFLLDLIETEKVE